jgi:protease IV
MYIMAKEKIMAKEIKIEKAQERARFPWGWFVAGIAIFILLMIILFIVGIIALIFSGGSGETTSGTGNVAVIPLNGVIMTGDSSGFFSEQNAVSGEIINMIKEADSNPSIKAIIVEIDSPGGSPVASDEIVQALKKTKKPTVALIREVGASGAYWAASACDCIVANRMSIVGSIGVIGSYLDFSGLLNRYNVSYERLVAGQYKDMGTPYRSLTDDERKILQQQLDSMHEIFILDVAENRNMSVDKLKKLANGLYYIGADGKKNGLVDILGGEEAAVSYIEEQTGIKAELVYYHKKLSFFDMLSVSMQKNSYNVGRGIGSSIAVDIGNGNPMI